jgi:hypothetical protein
METWRHGDMETWRRGHRDMVTWSLGHGDMDIRRHGHGDRYMDTWTWRPRIKILRNLSI